MIGNKSQSDAGEQSFGTAGFQNFTKRWTSGLADAISHELIPTFGRRQTSPDGCKYRRADENAGHKHRRTSWWKQVSSVPAC